METSKTGRGKDIQIIHHEAAIGGRGIYVPRGIVNCCGRMLLNESPINESPFTDNESLLPPSTLTNSHISNNMPLFSESPINEAPFTDNKSFLSPSVLTNSHTPFNAPLLNESPINESAFTGDKASPHTSFHESPLDTSPASPLRVAAYCRVSTLEEEQQHSYDTQCAHYAHLIAADPALTFAGVYGDQGASGLHADKRPAFLRLIADCEAGKIDLVMTKSISRFSRNLSDCATYVRRLGARGIPVYFEKEGFGSLDRDCEFLLSVLSALAQEEVSGQSRRIRWSLDHRNAVGDPARPARYGYRKIIETGRIIWRIEEREAARVRLAFSLAARGQDYRAIVTALNEDESREQSPARWSRPRVRDMLLNETYVGDILTNKTFRPDYLSRRAVKNAGQRAQYYLENHHEPIIDRETFARVGALVRGRALSSARAGGGGRVC